MWARLLGSGVIAQSSLVSLANQFFIHYRDQLLPDLNVASKLLTCRVNVWQANEMTQAQSTQATAAGGKIQPELPASVAACITWPLAVHYRGGHPRTYLCGFSDVDMETTTTWLPAFVTDLSAKAGSFHTLMETATSLPEVTFVEHGVLSFQRQKQWRDVPVFYRIANGARVDPRIDTQRRRLGRDLP